MKLFRRTPRTRAVPTAGDRLMQMTATLNEILVDAAVGTGAHLALNSVIAGIPYTTSEVTLGAAIGDLLIERGFNVVVGDAGQITFTHPDGTVVTMIEPESGTLTVALAPKTDEAK